MKGENNHFILVHGSTLGGWSWFKVASLLREAGHKVSTLDLKAAGIHPATADQVPSFTDYSQPLIDLLESIPNGERVVLVGHSFGGLSIALAAEKFPAKVSAAVFVSAFMPQPSTPPSQLLHNYFFVQKDRIDSWEDCNFIFNTDVSQNFPVTVDFGARFITSTLCNNCSNEDYTLLTMLKRATPYYRDDLSSENFVSKTNYGSTKRAYIVCKDDKIITESFQRWMIEMSPVDQVVEIEGADHMPLFSTPADLCHHLLHIAQTLSS